MMTSVLTYAAIFVGDAAVEVFVGRFFRCLYRGEACYDAVDSCK